MLVFPAWVDNPYLNLMSLAPRTSGYEFVGATTFDSLRSRVRTMESGDIVHLHWTTPILQKADSLAEAVARLQEFTQLLDDLRSRRIRLVWTLHNRLPHELHYYELEVELYRLLAERSDMVHVMSPDTAEVVADVCTLRPESVQVIPHMSYQGVYGGKPSRAGARRRFGIAGDDLAVLFFGQVRPYKGLDLLFDAVERLAEESDRPVVLLLAGAVREETPDEVLSRLPKGVRVVSKLEFIPDSEVGDWFAAADLAVFPYRAILNSGSAHLAAAYDVPVVLPGERHLIAQFGAEPWVSFFDLESPEESLLDVLKAAQPLNGALLAADFNARLSPWTISRRYRDALDGLHAGEGVDVESRTVTA